MSKKLFIGIILAKLSEYHSTVLAAHVGENIYDVWDRAKANLLAEWKDILATFPYENHILIQEYSIVLMETRDGTSINVEMMKPLGIHFSCSGEKVIYNYNYDSGELSKLLALYDLTGATVPS